MKIISTYPAKIKESAGAFETTAALYRQAVDYFIGIMLNHWDGSFSTITNSTFVVRATELLCWPTARRPLTKYDFGKSFYKFPSYLRRAAINEAYGLVSSYHTRLKQWKANPQGKEPGQPKAGRTFPAMYREVMFKNTTDRYTVRIKVFIRNTWDWAEVKLRKSDMDYIAKYCPVRKACVPTLRRRGKTGRSIFLLRRKENLRILPSANKPL